MRMLSLGCHTVYLGRYSHIGKIFRLYIHGRIDHKEYYTLLILSYLLTKPTYLPTYLLIAIQPLWTFFSLLNYTLDRTFWKGHQPSASSLPTRRTTQKTTQTSMLWTGFEPTIPALERVKTVHALHRRATVIDTDQTISEGKVVLINIIFKKKKT
jgi:hypothetical protein